MLIENQPRERGGAVFGATTEGERGAAEAAVERLRAKLDEFSRSDPPIEMKFSLPDQMVGPAVHRPASALWRAALPVSAAALDDDHSQGAATLFPYCCVAAVLRAAHGPLALFRADDRAADLGVYPRRYR